MAYAKITRHSELEPLALASLNADDRALVDSALLARESSHSPYSQFAVGAALRLRNGQIVKGSNQENAAYPSGLCAERTALFFAGAEYPREAVEKIVVCVPDRVTHLPFPCGACLQVMAESQARQAQALEVWLLHPSEPVVYRAANVDQLLPFAFVKDNLEKKG